MIGAITAVVALLRRRTLHETTAAEQRGSKGAGTMAELFKHHKAAFLTVLGSTAGASLIFSAFPAHQPLKHRRFAPTGRNAACRQTFRANVDRLDS